MIIDLTKSTKGYSTSIKSKFLRLLWIFTWYLVRFLPKQFSPIKVLVLKLFGAEIGDKCLIDFGVKIWIPENLVLKEGFVAIGKNVEIYNYAKVEIKKMTVISQYCYLITGTHDYTDPVMPLIWKPITIESQVWVSAGCWVFPGVSIGEGSVIGARSNVTRNMPPWQVCAGSPCKPIKDRIVKS